MNMNWWLILVMGLIVGATLIFGKPRKREFWFDCVFTAVSIVFIVAAIYVLGRNFFLWP